MIQLALPFQFDPKYAAFLSADSNMLARASLAQSQDWPDRRLAIWGESGCGKTHLLHLWAHRRPLLNGANLPAFYPPCDLAIDDADVSDPHTLLHLLNACAESGYRVVMAARTPPARWNTGLADLDSRLRAILAVPIGPPEDSLLDALLRHLLAERQLQVTQAVQDWLRQRLPRTAQTMREAAGLLDAAVWQSRGPVTRAVAAAVVEKLAPGGEAPHSEIDEVLSTSSPPLSSAGQGVA